MSAQPSYPCTVRERRAAMTEDEFWADVAESLGQPQADTDGPDDVEVISLNADPCPTCGERGPCGYDLDGRPLIHPVDVEGEL